MTLKLDNILFLGKFLDKYEKIIEILYPAVQKVFGNRRNIAKSFEICGLYPFNPMAISADKTAPATVFAAPKPATVTSGALEMESIVAPKPATVTSGALELETSAAAATTEPTAPEPLSTLLVDEFCPQSEDISDSVDDSSSLPPSSTVSVPSSGSPPSTSTSSSQPSLTTCPPRSLEQKRKTLHQFEVNHLSEEQITEFEEFFSKKIFKVKEPLYLSWLFLKFAAVGTEEEVIDHVLDSVVPKGIPKSKKKRSNPLNGADKWAPQSQPFMELLHEQNERASKVPKLCARGRGRGGRGGRGRRGGRGGGAARGGAAT